MGRSHTIEPGEICLNCGICCKPGVFTDAKLTEQDRNLLLAAGFDLTGITDTIHFPCRFQQGACCTAYSARPAVCRGFICKTLDDVQQGDKTIEQGRDIATRLARAFADFSDSLPDGMSAAQGRELLLDGQPLSGMAMQDFRRMQLAFTALQVMIDRYVRWPGQCVVSRMGD